DQELTQRLRRVAGHQPPGRHDARMRRETSARIEEEGEGDHVEAGGIFARDREIASAGSAHALIEPRERQRQHHEPELIEILELSRRDLNARDVVLDVTQGKEGERGIDLLIVDGPNRRHDDEDDAGNDQAALLPPARHEQMHENVDHQDHEQRDDRIGREAIADDLRQQVGSDQRYGDDRQELAHFELPEVRARAIGAQISLEHAVVAEPESEADRTDAEGQVPAVEVQGADADHPGGMILEPRSEEDRDERADIERHVVDGEQDVELGMLTFIQSGYQVVRIDLEQPISQGNEAQGREQRLIERNR